MFIKNWLAAFGFGSASSEGRINRRIARRIFGRNSACQSRIAAIVESLESRSLLSGITVNIGGDTETNGSITLRDAIKQANTDSSNGLIDTITFASSLTVGGAAKITLTQGELFITGSMTIVGPGANSLSIDGNNASRVFNIDANDNHLSNVSISGLTVTHGSITSGFGAGIFNRETLKLFNTVISSNTDSDSNGYGGGVSNSGSVISVNNLISDSVTGAYGGGIVNFGTWVSTNDTVSNNSSTGGGGIENTGHFTSRNDTIINNQASSGGGIEDDGVWNSTNDLIVGNMAISNGFYTFGGGGLFVYDGGTWTSNGDSIVGNIYTGRVNEDGSGGGIFVLSGSVISTHDDISNNSATTADGGGISIRMSGQLFLNEDAISKNSSDQVGGGIFNYGANVTVSNSTIATNVAKNAGGGSSNDGIMTSFGNTIIGNQTTGSGGGFENDGTLISTNDTVVGNSAQTGSGYFTDSSLQIVNDTVTGNSASQSGGGINEFGGTASAWNSIISGNMAKQTGSDVSGGSFDTTTNQIGGDVTKIFVTDAKGNPILANNGGPTQTVALVQNSLADATAVPLTTLGTDATSSTAISIGVSDVSRIGVGTSLQLDHEIVTVQAIFGNSLSVLRGQFGTAAATHVAGTPISLATDQRGNVRGTNDRGSVSAAAIAITANPLVVTTTSDTHVDGQVTLREAINTANTSKAVGTITFAPGLRGAITLTSGQLLVSNSMTIVGPGSNQLSINAGGTSQIFVVNANDSGQSRVAISGLTLADGSTVGDGGAILNAEQLSLNDIAIVGCSATGSGGAIENRGQLKSTNDWFVGNSAGAGGGGIDDSGTLNSTNDEFSGNVSSSGGGGGIQNQGLTTINDDTISENFAGGSGGGLANVLNGTLNSNANLIANNSSGNDGAGVFSTNLFASANDTIYGNVTAGQGGGISSTGTIALTNDTITWNYAAQTGGVVGSALAASVNSIISGNHANGANIDVNASGISSTNNQIGGTISKLLVTNSVGQPLLADNGGPLPTIALAAGSPAVGKASALAKLVADLSATSTTATIDNAAYIPVGLSLKLDSEIVTVLSVQGSHLTLLRGQANTSAAAHSANATLFTALDDRDVIRPTNDQGAIAAARSNLLVTTIADTHVTGQTTLREAVAQANADPAGGDTISFATGLTGLISLLQGELAFNNSMNIVGPGSSQLTISANYQSRIFDSLPAGPINVSISGLTVTEGNATMGLHATPYGGAIFVSSSVNLSATDLTISHSLAPIGGGIYSSGVLNLNASKVVGNSSNSGRFIYLGNIATPRGGGIDNDGVLHTSGDTISGNYALFVGGGILNDGGTITSFNDVISGNQGIGGGIYNSEGQFSGTSDVFAGNSSTDSGGAVYNDGDAQSSSARFSLFASTISGNSAVVDGGSIFNSANSGNASLLLTNDTLVNNSAGSGGGISADFSGSSVVLTNTTISGNTSATSGGGVLITNHGKIVAINSIVAGNKAKQSQPDLAGTLNSSTTNIIGGDVTKILATDSSGMPILANNGGPTQTVALAQNSPAARAGSKLASSSSSVGKSDTSLTVNDATYLMVGDQLRLDNEIILVTAINGTTLTVQRAQNTSIAAGHAANSPLHLAFDQRGFIRQATDLGAYGTSQNSIVVTSLSDAHIDGETTLREAIAIANFDQYNDTISFDPGLFTQGAATITLTGGEFPVTDLMTIAGPGSSKLTIDANNTSRIFSVYGGSEQKVTISGITLRNGNGTGDSGFIDGGAIYNNADLTLSNDSILTSTSSEFGGGVANFGSLKTSQVTFMGNSATANGGGVFNQQSYTSKNDVFTSNSTPGQGGGVDSPTGTLTLNSDTFNSNSAKTGGAINNGASAKLSDNTISKNSAQDGGGIGNTTIATMTSTNDTIAQNAVTGVGGAVANAGTLVIVGDTVSENSAPTAGGINNDGNITVLNSTIVGNSANGNGGAIYNSSNGSIGGVLTLINDTLTGNAANLLARSFVGGAVDNSATVNAVNSLILGNTANGVADDVDGQPFTTSSGNLIGIPKGQTLANVLQTVAGSNPPQPQLANNGGTTQTVELVPNSPALDTAVALTTLSSSGLSSTATSVSITAPTFIAIGETIRMDAEFMTVTSVTGTDMTLLRGQFGTTGASHSANSEVFLGSDQRGSVRFMNDVGSVELSQGVNITPLVGIQILGGVYIGKPYAVQDAIVLGLNGIKLATFGSPSLTYVYYSGTLTASQLATATPLSGPPKNVGSYTVVAKYKNSVSGYTDAHSQPFNFSITPASLTIAAVTATKVYDGTTATKSVPKVIGLLGTDTVTNLSEVFASKDVLGINDSTLQANAGYVVHDGDSGNDYIVTVSTSNGTITPASLTLKPTTNTKFYDATTNALAKPTASGLIGTDSIVGLSESYLSKNVLGSGKSTLVVNSGYSIEDGNHGQDYSVFVNSVLGTITPVPLTITALTNTKVYDGTTSATAIPTTVGLLGTDTVKATELYQSNAILGLNKSTLIVNPGYAIGDGNNGHNYSVILATAAGTITAGVPSKLVFTSVPPAKGTAGQSLGSTVTLAVEDRFGNVVTSDSSSVTLTVSAWTLTSTAANGVATFSIANASITKVGTYVWTAGDASLIKISSPLVISAATGSQLVITQSPTSGTAGTVLAPALKVVVEDRYGNLLTTATSKVILSLGSGPGNATFTPSSTLTVTAVNGIATFSNLTLDTAGTYTLSAKTSDSSLGSITSGTLTISPSVPAKLSLLASTDSVAAGSPLSAMKIAVDDAFGNLVTSASTLAVALAKGTFANGTTNNAVKTTAGVATLSSLTIDMAGANTLKVSDASLSGLSINLTVTPASASQLVFVNRPPATAIAGTGLGTKVLIAVEDSYGNVVISNASVVTLTVGSKSSTTSSSAGTATFDVSSLALTKAGSYTWTATDGSLAKATSNLSVSPSAATQLVINQSPTAGTAGVPLATSIKVTIEDTYGNVAIADSSTTSLSILTGPKNGVFTAGSVLTSKVTNGVATFNNLILNTIGVYTFGLTDSSAKIPSVTTGKLTIAAAAAAKTVVITAPASATAGTSLSTIQIGVQDQFGNLIPSATNVTLTLSSGQFSNGKSTATATTSLGIATFTNLMFVASGTYAVNVSSASLTASSFKVTVNPAAATKLMFQQTPPSMLTAGSPIGNRVSVAIEDSYGNLMTSDASSVTLIALGTTLTLPAVHGVATFDLAKIFFAKAGTGSWTARDGKLTPTTSNLVVTPNVATQVVWKQTAIAQGTVGIAINSKAIAQVEDTYGNLVTTNSSHMILTVGTNKFTSTVANGVATFSISNLSITTAGSYTWTASDVSLTPATSSLVISPGAATKLIYLQSPPTTGTAGVASQPQFSVGVIDNYGNTVTTDNSTVTLSIGGNTYSVQASNGIAGFRFSSFTILTAGTYSWTVTDGKLASATSNLTVFAAAPSQLVFVNVPSSGGLNTGLSSAVTVAVEDAFGNIVTGDSSKITLTIATGPAGGSFSSGTSVTVSVVDGVATFTGLKFSKAGTYTLKASDGSLTVAISTSIKIS